MDLTDAIRKLPTEKEQLQAVILAENLKAHLDWTDLFAHCTENSDMENWIVLHHSEDIDVLQLDDWMKKDPSNEFLAYKKHKIVYLGYDY